MVYIHKNGSSNGPKVSDKLTLKFGKSFNQKYVYVTEDTNNFER